MYVISSLYYEVFQTWQTQKNLSLKYKIQFMCYSYCIAGHLSGTSYTFSYLGSLIPWGVRNFPRHPFAEAAH